MRVKPFMVQVTQQALDDLRDRLERTRWTDEVEDDGWDHGTNRSYLRDVDGVGVHFIHERGKGDRPLPIILTHGYPDSFVRFLKIIPMLSDPQAHGGDAADAFDVVVPSLPGYGFSDKPAQPGFTFRIGDVWHTLMTETLGYERFAAHGGDWGGTVTEQLARSHARSLVGVHLTDVPFWHLFQKPGDLSSDEQRYVDAMTKWQQKDGATRPGQRPLTRRDSDARWPSQSDPATCGCET